MRNNKREEGGERGREGEERKERKGEGERGLGGKRDKDKKKGSEFVHTSVCVCMGWLGWAPGLPSSTAHSSQSVANLWPLPGVGIQWVESVLSLLIYLNHPELAISSHLTRVQPFLSTLQSNFSLIIHYNLMGPLSYIWFITD